MTHSRLRPYLVTCDVKLKQIKDRYLHINVKRTSNRTDYKVSTGIKTGAYRGEYLREYAKLKAMKPILTYYERIS